MRASRLPSRGQALRWAGWFVVAVTSLGLPWFRGPIARGLAACGDVVLSAVMFGRGGHARLVADGSITAYPGQPSEDAKLLLSVDGFRGELPVGISLRREVYLPVVLFIGLVAGAPLSVRRRLACLGVGVPALLAWGLACLAMTAAWLLGTQLRGVYFREDVSFRVLEIVGLALLTPPSNRYMVSVGLALVVLLVARRGDGQRAESRGRGLADPPGASMTRPRL